MENRTDNNALIDMTVARPSTSTGGGESINVENDGRAHSKYSNLSFKTKVKTKGRKRKPKTQHSYKKTTYDKSNQVYIIQFENAVHNNIN